MVRQYKKAFATERNKARNLKISGFLQFIQQAPFKLTSDS